MSGCGAGAWMAPGTGCSNTQHAPELSAETLRQPKVVLVAREFPPVVTATCVWLAEMGLDIQLTRFQAYRSGEQTLLTVSRLFPVPDVEDFTISPRQAEVKQASETKKRSQDVSAVRRLVEAGAIPDGTELTLAMGPGVGSDAREAIDMWGAEAAARRRAVWRNDSSAPLQWAADGNCYSPSGLCRHIIREATGVDRSVQGTRWWVDGQGRDLVELTKTTITGRGGKYFAFWARLLGRIHQEHPDWTDATAPQTTNWMVIRGPRSGTQYGFSFTGTSQLRAELYIDFGERDANKDFFDTLAERREEIEAAFGAQLSWERLDSKRASRIAAYRTGDVDNTDRHEEYIDWFINASQQLRQALPVPD